MCKNRGLATLMVLVWFVLPSGNTLGQSEFPRFEASAVFTAIRQRDDFYQIVRDFPPRIRHNFGFGGRFGVNVNESVALEGEITFYPKERFLFIGGLFPGQVGDAAQIGGKRVLGLFGAKAGKRVGQFGIFGKLRPGFIRFDQVPDCPGGEVARCTFGPKSEPALDFGGVVEYYPTDRLVLRFDAGDTVIWYDHLTRANFGGLPPDPRFPLEVGGGTSHSPQYSIAIGVRF